MKINTSEKSLLLIGTERFFGTCISEELDKRKVSSTILKDNLHPLKHNTAQPQTSSSLLTQTSLQFHLSHVQTIISAIHGATVFDLAMCYRNNIRLIQESKNASVKKIVFVLSEACSLQKDIGIIAEKNRFLKVLDNINIDYTIVKASALFSNFVDFLNMANSGKVYLHGNIHKTFSPVHLRDLAAACVDAIEINHKEVCIVGPETLTLRKIAQMAFDVIEKPYKIIHTSTVKGKLVRFKKRLFKVGNKVLPTDFCPDLVVKDCITLPYGTRYLRAFFKNEAATFGNKTQLT